MATQEESRGVESTHYENLKSKEKGKTGSSHFAGAGLLVRCLRLRKRKLAPRSEP